MANPDTDTVTSTVDTTERAGATPDHTQPYRELGLAGDEYARIRAINSQARMTAQARMMAQARMTGRGTTKAAKRTLRFRSQPIRR